MSVVAFDQAFTSYSLSELLSELKDHIDVKYKGDGFWVKGELSDWASNLKSGHFYGELVEYASESSKQTKAKARLNMWAGVAEKVIPKFSQATGEPIKAGMKVLLYVQVSYNINFGFSLNVLDVDPSFTLGDREARKQQIIKSLTEDGIINNNRLLPSPIDFTKVAVISSETAAGKGDFFAEADYLQGLGLCEFVLYPTIMQGEECAKSVTNAFRKIYSDIKTNVHQFDAVVLIRGGGSQADLDAFNHLTIAKAICHMPSPAFIGIGHERDKTVLDDLAHMCFDTPSKVVAYIQHVILSQAKQALSNYDDINQLARTIIQTNQYSLYKVDESIKVQSQGLIQRTHQSLTKLHSDVQNLALSVCQSSKRNLNKLLSGANSLCTSLIKVNSDKLDAINQSVSSGSRSLIRIESQKIDAQFKNIHLLSNVYIRSENKNLDDMYQSWVFKADTLIQRLKDVVESRYKNILALSIEPTLKRGFALTKDENGRCVSSAEQAKQLTQLTVTYHDGDINTEIKI